MNNGNWLTRVKTSLRTKVLWLIVVVCIVAAAGATGLGQSFIGHIPTAVSQAVLIDSENFDEKDLGKAAQRAHVSVNDEGTAASIGAMVATGDMLIFDVPLINMSDNDATVRATLDIPGPLTDDVDVFWNTLTRYTTPAAQTTTPSPAPFTSTSPQSSDTTFSLDVITGAVEIEPQTSNSSALLDTVQPDMTIISALTGLPDITPQPRNGIEYTVQRPGSATINAQSVNASLTLTHNKLDATPPNQYWGAGPVVVDSAGNVGQYSSLAAKNEDVLYVSYYEDNGFSGRVLFKKSLNGGTTWGSAVEVDDTLVNSMAMAACGDSIFIAYWAGFLYVSSSTDGGESWDRAVVTYVPTTNFNISVAAVDEETVFVSFLNSIVIFDWGTLTVARSSDAGEHFYPYDMSPVMVGIPMINGVSGAPAMSALDDGKVYCSYVLAVDIPVFPPLDIAVTISTLIVASSTHIPGTPFGLTSWNHSTPLLVVPTGMSIANIPIPAGFLGDCTSLYALDENNIFVSYTYKPSWILPTTLWFARSVPYTNGRIFSPGFPVDVPGFCPPFGVSIDNSITATDDSTVIITYYNEWVGDLMMAKSDDYGAPFTWDYYHLDGNKGSPYSNGNVGRYNSLTTVDGSTLFTMVSYYDLSAEDLRFYAETPGDQNYYTAKFREDWDADGELNDLYCVLTDLDDDDNIDRIDLSQDSTFGEADLHDIQTWTDDDERIWKGPRTGTSQDDHLGKYWFNVYFQHELTPADDAFASITSKSWFENSYYIDLDVDAVSDEPVYFVLSDTNSNGLYDTLELSGDDMTYGEIIPGLTTLTDYITGDDDDLNDDERVQKIATEENIFHALYENIRIGRYYTFNTAWDTNPGTDLAPEPTNDIVDTLLTALSRFIGEFDFDVDADGSLVSGGGNKALYALSDNNSDGLYDIMNMSSPDVIFNHGDLEDDRLLSSPENDEWIRATTNDLWSDHATIDPDSNNGTMWWGPYNWCWVDVTFDPNPPADLSDTTVLTLNRHTALPGWTIDADGDEVADNEVYFVLSDTDSNGDVDVMDVSIGDKVFGEGIVNGRIPPLKDGAVDFFAADNFNDERIDFADFPYILQLGLHYFSVDADTALLDDNDDGRITSRWYVGTFPVDVDNDIEDNVIDFVQVDPDSDGVYTIFELDGDDSNSYDASEVHDHSDTILDMIGHRVRLFYRQNPAVVHSAVLRDGEIINMVPAGEFQWIFTVPAEAKPGKEQSQLRIAIEVPPDALPGYYKVSFILEQVR